MSETEIIRQLRLAKERPQQSASAGREPEFAGLCGQSRETFDTP